MSVYMALCTPKLRPGAVKSNTQEIISCIERTKKADLLIFPRLSITGATCGSMYAFPSLTDGAKAALKQIASSVSTDKTVVVGLPMEEGGAVYDTTAVISGGKTKLYHLPKGLYDGDSEALSFGSDEISLEIDDLGIKIVSSFPSGDEKHVSSFPNGDEKHVSPFPSGGDEIVVVQSAYPAYLGKRQELRAAMGSASAVISSGAGESVSGKIMSGDKLVRLGDKEYYAGFDEETLLVKLGKIKGQAAPTSTRPVSLSPLTDDECDEIYGLMGRGIVGRMNEIGCKKVILGLSGGLDSANVLVATVLAFEKYKLDKKNIICVTMRGSASSKRTQDNASALIEAYGVTGMNVPIDTAVTLHMRAIDHAEKDVVYENAQARERTQILLDLSNKFGALMLGTGDLSEICLGWSTFGGDQLSQYDPNCSLTKTAIRKLLTHYVASKHNKAAAKILNDVINTPVSPELVSGQETEAILGSYEIHDLLIEELIAKRRSPKEALENVVKCGFPQGEVKKCLSVLTSRFFRYQFKRNFGPDGVKLFPYDLVGMTIRSDFIGEMWE